MINPIAGYIAAAALALGVLGGWTIRDWKAEADQAKVAQKNALLLAKAQDAAEQQAAAFEEQRQASAEALAKRTNTVREYYRYATAPPAVCELPADMHSLLASSVADANAQAAGQPSSAVRPATSAADDRP